jgi:SpoVK/Ycf46/Vps4 family AAA+-type ATPase
MSSAQKAENNIQNIILEELENFDGIFIATTNLLKNIDSAFDRRFLFKVLFTKPTLEVRSKIWQDKFSELNREECLELAAGYELTGGQIDNVYRKSQISALVNGTRVSVQSVKEYCEQERNTRAEGRTGKIGFLKSAG